MKTSVTFCQHSPVRPPTISVDMLMSFSAHVQLYPLLHSFFGPLTRFPLVGNIITLPERHHAPSFHLFQIRSPIPFTDSKHQFPKHSINDKNEVHFSNELYRDTQTDLLKIQSWQRVSIVKVSCRWKCQCEPTSQ